ncbi:helix-turn-helix domain-containing protein [Promicromonospora panici]|uniref:helix-turn-helix domain-containing protein n=1 Tax=Promicromonospora panici TaxID=2219658 RepID=UPI0013ECBB3C
MVLARRVDRSRASISQLEAGVRTPSLGSLEAILAALGKQLQVELEPGLLRRRADRGPAGAGLPDRGACGGSAPRCTGEGGRPADRRRQHRAFDGLARREAAPRPDPLSPRVLRLLREQEQDAAG